MTATSVQKKKLFNERKVRLPAAFIMRRVHSLLGLWLVIYLFEHLLVNSQLAFYFQDNGHGFIHMVNKIHELPYLKLIEIFLLAIPFLIHGSWGLLYLKTSKPNSHKTRGNIPNLSKYERNHAYTWQRWTSWILIVGIFAHVIHMRFVDSPHLIYQGIDHYYVTKVSVDPGLYNVVNQLNVTLVDQQEIAQIETLKQRPLREGEVIAMSPNAGIAFLLVAREAFKNPLIVILYSILVLSAAFHGFNGLWTFLISWGITLTRRSQKILRYFCQGFMILVAIMGLAAAWGTYIIVYIQGV
ncbi:MAG: succinate dehydrogenase [Chlamydiia bacterium]|nr:succinate dehydrogenase [Chlamydiia bacterium]